MKASILMSSQLSESPLFVAAPKMHPLPQQPSKQLSRLNTNPLQSSFKQISPKSKHSNEKQENSPTAHEQFQRFQEMRMQNIRV